MRRKLFDVGEVTYTVSGVLVLAGIVETHSSNMEKNDLIIIVLPNGNEIKAQAKSGGTFKVQNKIVHSVLINKLKKENIPLGSIVFADEN